jgi:hypothetical protein
MTYCKVMYSVALGEGVGSCGAGWPGGNTPDLYSGGARLERVSAGIPTVVVVVVVVVVFLLSTVPPGICWDTTSSRPRPLLNTF